VSRPAVTAFRGVPPPDRPGSGNAGPPPLTPGAERPPVSLNDRLLHPVPARGVAFVALLMFGAFHWMRMLEPPEPTRAWYAVAIGVMTASGLFAAARLPRGPRAIAVALTLAGGLGLAIVGAGAADELLTPARWDELAGGIGRGLDSLPGARVPYRGLDEWLRLIIALGGTLLALIAAALAFWPRRGGKLGYPAPALVALVTLYAVPAVALIFDKEFLRGALLALLVVGFLRLERLRRRDAAAAGFAATATIALALVLAPALDGIDPWWDYESWALSSAGSRSTTFTWEHDYGPLRWPRDGRELLRVRSKVRTYWKADQLDDFDGVHWIEGQDADAATEAPEQLVEGVEIGNLEKWSLQIRVAVRNLRSETFVAAGSLIDEGIMMPRRPAIPTVRAGIFRSTRTLRRGDTYRAQVYVPRPSDRQLQRAGDNWSAYDLDRYTRISADPQFGLSAPVRDSISISYDGFKTAPSFTDPREVGNPDALLKQTALARPWRLAQRLLAQSDSSYDYVRAVEKYLSRGYAYSENPPEAAQTLDGFLFDAKVGYCQQFSGAMALLLRMGGVPTRVATGFSPGSYDEDAKEYVVRDVDAHSWVEVWFAGIGWVTFDPTPTTAPPRSQADGQTAASAAIGDIRDLGTATYDPRTAGTAAKASRPWGLYGGIAAVGLVLVAVGRRVRRRRRVHGPASGLELERALRITGAGAAGVTLSALESRFAGSPNAAGYVRALRAQRYASVPEGPTRAQRRGLRRALAHGRGVGGRMRAWWALPPRWR
jgi:transglutaminase-like putative cysteine protease